MRLPENRALIGLVNELLYKKDFEETNALDKLSHSDYFQAAAFIAIKEMQGPNLLNELTFGRKDIELD